MSEVNIEGVADAIVKMVIASLKKDLAESVARIERLEKALRGLVEKIDDCTDTWNGLFQMAAIHGATLPKGRDIGPELAIARTALEEKP